MRKSGHAGRPVTLKDRTALTIWLDKQSAERLDRKCAEWAVSRGEAVRRAIKATTDVNLTSDEVLILEHLTCDMNYKDGTPTLERFARSVRYKVEALPKILENLEMKGLLRGFEPMPDAPFTNDVLVTPTKRLRVTPEGFKELEIRDKWKPGPH